MNLVKLPASFTLGPGMVIEKVTLGLKCQHCKRALQVGDTPYCPHVAPPDDAEELTLP